MIAAILTAFFLAEPPQAPPVREPSQAPPIRAPKALPRGPLHSHRCPFDGTVWTHGDGSFGNRAAHACPKCGRVIWQVYQRNVQNIATDGWSYPTSVTQLPCPPGKV